MSEVSPKNMLRTVMEDLNRFLRDRGKDTVSYDTRDLKPDQDLFDYFNDTIVPQFAHDLELKRAAVGVMLGSVKRLETDHERAQAQIDGMYGLGVRR